MFLLCFPSSPCFSSVSSFASFSLLLWFSLMFSDVFLFSHCSLFFSCVDGMFVLLRSWSVRLFHCLVFLRVPSFRFILFFCECPRWFYLHHFLHFFPNQNRIIGHTRRHVCRKRDAGLLTVFFAKSFFTAALLARGACFPITGRLEALECACTVAFAGETRVAVNVRRTPCSGSPVETFRLSARGTTSDRPKKLKVNFVTEMCASNLDKIRNSIIMCARSSVWWCTLQPQLLISQCFASQLFLVR